jgi:hypothetical protein
MPRRKRQSNASGVSESNSCRKLPFGREAPRECLSHPYQGLMNEIESAKRSRESLWRAMSR